MKIKQRKISPWGYGIHQTASGHLRYHAPLQLIGEYVHRKVILDRIAETPYSVRLLLPYPYDVHHLDFNKTHNCDYNLCMLDHSLHSAITADHQRFRPRWKPVPQWKLWDEDEVPF